MRTLQWPFHPAASTVPRRPTGLRAMPATVTFVAGNAAPRCCGHNFLATSAPFVNPYHAAPGFPGT